jgi:hypothetical protein
MAAPKTDLLEFDATANALWVSLALGQAEIAFTGLPVRRLANLERVNGGLGADAIIGADGAETLAGGDGNDRVEGGGRGDSLSSGSGIADMLSYVGSQGAVSIDLGLGTASGGDAQGDSSTGFKGMTGGAFADNLRGSANGDIPEGTGGNNTLDGGEQDDIAVFSGNRADYVVTTLVSGGFSVADQRGGLPDGTDTVRNVEVFRLADGDLAAAALDPLTPQFPTEAADTLLGTAGADSISGLGGADSPAGIPITHPPPAVQFRSATGVGLWGRTGTRPGFDRGGGLRRMEADGEVPIPLRGVDTNPASLGGARPGRSSGAGPSG